jgi:hypothetical protein
MKRSEVGRISANQVVERELDRGKWYRNNTKNCMPYGALCMVLSLAGLEIFLACILNALICT